MTTSQILAEALLCVIFWCLTVLWIWSIWNWHDRAEGIQKRNNLGPAIFIGNLIWMVVLWIIYM